MSDNTEAARNTAADADRRMAGLLPPQRAQLHAAARAIRDGGLAQAEKILDGVLQQAPGQSEALRLCGILHNRARRFDAAVAALKRALARWPEDAMALNDLGTALAGAGDMPAALDAWRQACTLAPDFPLAWFNLGRNLQQRGDSQAAVTALLHACGLAPGMLPARILAADALVHLGRFDEADTHYRIALEQHPACGDAWRGLANMKTRALSDADVDALAGLLARGDVAEADRIGMGFALGKACEDRARYADAFAALNDANARMQRLQPWQADAFHRHVAQVVQATMALPAPVDPRLGREAIFIVGLPRSGSTLFEQILAAHPQVEGASELPDLDAVIAEESRRRGQPFPQWVASTQAATWQRLGRRYLERTRHWREMRPRHTDKMPGNWLYAGVLAAMLPAATIIDARRDALEAGWSCFKQQFYRLPHFACDLSDIAAYIRDYEQAMDAWHKARAGYVRIQRYEALLDDPEAQVRALLAFCGLPFDPACLDFHRAERSVRTASAAQVRQPLRRDTRRAHHYGALLDPLRLGLELR